MSSSRLESPLVFVERLCARFSFLSRLAIAAAMLLGLVNAEALAQRGRIAPEASSGHTARQLATATRHMVAAANPYAVQAGLSLLRAGGSAIDAAIAIQLVLNLVEPQSSGIGGGAFILHWNDRTRSLTSYDGRETAPAAAQPDRFLVDGKPMAFRKAVAGGLSVGVPGTLRVLELAHRKHGKLPWRRLFEPAIALAQTGFKVSSRLSFLLDWHGAKSFSAGARRYFFDAESNPWPAGHTLRNLDFAETLTAIAERGADAFYTGPIAKDIVAAVVNSDGPKGDIALGDLAGYRAIEREPFCTIYRTRRVCGMGPPSSGGPTVAQILKLIEPFDISRPMSGHALHIIAEAQKLAYADRNRYMADPDFVPLPSGLLDADYLKMRRALIAPLDAMARPAAGVPPGLSRRSLGEDATRENVGTSHISIIDGDGNAVSMTTTIEGAFGSGLWVRGFLLNNELTDFSFRPVDANGTPIANAVAPGKRPRSSMAPTIVFTPEGKVEIVLGSPGGSRIILYVTKTLVAMIDWKMNAQEAAALINFGSRGGPFEIEFDISAPWFAVARAVWQALKMKSFGHQITFDFLTSGTHIVARGNGRIEGGADPRREGVALGD